MKSSTVKKIIKFVLILVFIMFVHDLFSDLSSEKLFFPKLFENDCFHQIFDKNITDEKIISFNCYTQWWWWGSDEFYKIAFFCDKQCFSSLFEFEYQMLEQSKMGEIKEKSLSSNF